MKKNTVYGYARVSTNQQDLNLQIEILENEGCEQIFKEKISGKRTDRPKFNELLGILKEGDTLIAIANENADRFSHVTSKEYMQQIMELNGMNSEHITAGQYILLPDYIGK